MPSDQILDSFNKAVNYLTSPLIQEKLLTVKIVFIIFSIFFLFVIIFVLFKSNYIRYLFWQDLKESLAFRPAGSASRNAERWAKIKKRLQKAGKFENKRAVVEANGMMDEALKKMGYKGKTTGEKLKQLTPEVLPHLDKVMEAYRIYSSVTGSPDYELSFNDAKEAIESYETALRDLQVI